MAAGVATAPAPAPPGIPGGWRHNAACAGSDSDPELFFLPDGRTGRARRAAEDAARRVCAGCPVRRQCLATALLRAERHGVWGGLTGHEMKKLPSPNSAAAASAIADAVIGGTP